MEVLLILQMNHRNALRHRHGFHPYWVLPGPAESWFEIHFTCRIIPENFFFRQLRMKQNTFKRPLAILRPFLQRVTRFRNCITPEKVLGIGIYRLAHGGSFENAGVAMNVGKSTAIEAFVAVVVGLYELRNDYIKFPTTVAETSASIATFTHLSNLRNITGAIDGIHIKIKAPKDSAVDYFSHCQQHDVVVQAVVNGERAFLDVAAGFPGSMHDALILRNGIIYDKAEHGDIIAAGPIHTGRMSDFPSWVKTVKKLGLKWDFLGKSQYWESATKTNDGS